MSSSSAAASPACGRCARLASAPVRITLVDRSNHHLFQPLLYQVATAGLSAPDIAAPLRHILRAQRNVDVLLARSRGIDADATRVALDDGSALDYDYLVLASGATHAYFGHDDWADARAGPEDARRRAGDPPPHAAAAFERAEARADPAEREAWLHFVVVGGGPTGVELAGTLAEIARHTLTRRIPPHRSARRRASA